MLRLVMNYIRQHKWVYIVVVLTLIVYDVTLLVPTQLIQRMVDTLTRQALTEGQLVQEMSLLLGVTLLNYAMAFIWHLKLFQSSIYFKFEMQQRAFHKLVKMRTPFYEKFRSGDILTRFSTDVDGLMEFIGYGLMVVVYAGGMIAFIVPTIVWIDWQISIVALLPILIMSVCITIIGRKQEQAVEDNRQAIADLNTEVLETVEGIRVSRAYGKKAIQAAHFAQKTKGLRQVGDRIAALQAYYAPLATFFLSLSNSAVLWIGASAVQTGRLSLGQLLALQLYVSSLLEPFWMLAEFILVYQTGITSFEKLENLLQTGDDLEEDGCLELTNLSCVEFKDYDFTYPQAKSPSLSGISWTLQAGQTVGIVGKTGSGKTSLIRQFLRQYPTGSGSFRVNGHPILAVKRASIEEKIGYVPQEHVLFSKSIRENIALGKAETSDYEIEKAIATAAFSKDIEQMKEGLDTVVGERGVALSGGQKQRISIARAFLSQPDLLILDDSLSAVDARTESQIIRHIQTERVGKTTVIVAHRLSAVAHADWILVLDKGRIVEEGSHAQLLAQKGWYYEQYGIQQGQEGEEE